MRRWLPWVAVALVLVAGLALGTRQDGGPRTEAERVEAVTASVRCPTCRGQSVRDSDAPVAAAIRSEVGRRLADGQTEDEVRAYLVGRYGRSVLLNPPRSGLAGLVWVLPVVAVVVAGAALALAFRRWRALLPVGSTATPEDHARVREARG